MIPELLLGVGPTRLEIAAHPAREWYECASCIEFINSDDDASRAEWSIEHARTHPGHVRFRSVRQQEFRVVPDVDGATP